MIVAEVANNLQSGGLTNQKGFTIKASEKAFHILSSSIYSNKIRAIIRELSCNALDAHRADKCEDKPFLVHLPSALNPVFYVQDYGIGLSKEEVEDLYTTYFESTKTTSNDFTGALGLGSKSPFSYVDSFTIISNYRGEKHSFVAYKDQRKLPAITHLSTVETDEPNGLYVELPVEDGDHFRFFSEAREVLAHFQTKPRVIGGDHYYSHVDIEVSESLGDDILIVDRNYSQSKICAVQGNVAYPLKHTDLDTEELELMLGNKQVILHFSIGDLNVAPSREDLDWDDSTLRVVSEKIKKLKDYLYADITDKVSQCATEIEAKRVLNDWLGDRGIPSYNQEKIKIEYGGNVLNTKPYKITAKALDSIEEGFKLCYFKAHVDKTLRNWIKIDAFTSASVSMQHRFMVAVDTKSGFNKRVHEYLRDKEQKGCYGFTYKSDEQCKAVSQLFGGIEIVKASEIVMPKHSSVSTRGSKRTKVLKYYAGSWEDCDVDLGDEGDNYIYVNLYRDSIEGGIQHVSDALTIANFFNKPLYGIRGQKNKDKVAKLPNWATVDTCINNFKPKESYLRFFKSIDVSGGVYRDFEKISGLLNTAGLEDEDLSFAVKLIDYRAHTREKDLRVRSRFPKVYNFYNLLMRKKGSYHYSVIDLCGLNQILEDRYPILGIVNLRYMRDDQERAVIYYLKKEK